MNKKFWKEVPIVILNEYAAFGIGGVDLPFAEDPPYLSIFKFKGEDRIEGGYFRKFYIDKSKKEVHLSAGRFTEKDMTEIFNKIEKSGFWQMPERLPSDVEDGSFRKIFINYYWLKGKTKEVVYHYGTPNEDEEVNFMKLFDEIADLANTKPRTKIIYEKH